MIKGVGTDIIKMDRVSLDEKHINRILSEEEKMNIMEDKIINFLIRSIIFNKFL